MQWQEIHQAALYQLLQNLITLAILAYPDFWKRFKWHTDASELGLGCALFQFQDKKLRVIGFGSRTLVGAELKYLSSKLQILALKWTVCEHLRDYLFYVQHFYIYTNSCKVNATGQRWTNGLADYILFQTLSTG